MQCYTVALHKRLVSAPVYLGVKRFNVILYDKYLFCVSIFKLNFYASCSSELGTRDIKVNLS